MKSNIKVQWDNIPENQKLAFASFVVELGGNADSVLDRMRRDSGFTQRLAQFAINGGNMPASSGKVRFQSSELRNLGFSEY